MPPSPEADQTPEWVRGDLPEHDESAGAEARPAKPTPERGPGDAASGDAVAASTNGSVGEEAGPAVPPDASGERQAAASESAPVQAGSAAEGGDPPALEPAGAAERPADVRAQAGQEPPPGGEARSANGDAPPAAKVRRRSRKARPAPNGSTYGAAGGSPDAERQSTGEVAPVDFGGLSLEAVLESLLFVADGPVPVAHLAEALSVHPRDVEDALNVLAANYLQRGLSLQRFRDRVQLTTAPATAAAVERFLGLGATTPLSRAALETLSIIAYQQPVTRPQIEAVRGVNSDSVIKNLLTKGLVEESGRAEGPGRPVLYSTTSEFLQHFGLASLGDLPPLALPGTTADTPPAAAHDEVLKG